MGDVIKLLPPRVSRDTVETLIALLSEARSGRVIGLSYVALHQGMKFSADIVGESKRSSIYTLGTIQCLNNYVLTISQDR